RRHKRRQSGAPLAHKMAKPCARGAESLASVLMALLAYTYNLFDPMLIQIITPKMAIQSSINPRIPMPTLSMLSWANENARTGSMRSLLPAYLFSLLTSLTSQWELLARISVLPENRT